MTETQRAKKTDYAVGYGRPPKHSQFKPGQSGNPKGRPRGIRPLGAVLRGIMEQKIPVTENGKTRRMPAIEVMLRRLANDAMRSDPKALKFLLSLVDRYGDAPQAATQLRDLLVEDQAILEEYMREHQGSSDPSAEGGEAAQ